MQGRRYEEFFDEVIHTLGKDLKEDAKRDLLVHPTEFRGASVDMPKKTEWQTHGSSYEILCNTKTYSWCKIKGDLVAEMDLAGKAANILEKSGCKIFSTHDHAKEERKHNKEILHLESQIHFMFLDKYRDETILMMNFLKVY